MGIMERPPKFDLAMGDSKDILRIFQIGQIPELQDLIRRANEEYLSWSEIRYRMPGGVVVKPEEVWAYLKFGRCANSKASEIKDVNDRPFGYWIPDSLYKAISEVDKWSGGTIITDQPDGLPEKERYIISSLMEEAIASSQLEGASTEYRVAKELLRTGRKPQDKNERMIVNNWKAMQFIRNNIKTEFSIDKIFELQAILTQDTLEDPNDSGKFRDRDDVVVYYRDEIVHVPPKVSKLSERMDCLCKFANNDDEKKWIHPVIKGAMIHFWLAYDHPFVDGNGRTARALMYWYLLNRGYSLFQYLSISKHFLCAPGQYVRAYLSSEYDDNDLTYFLVYNLESIHDALNNLRKYLERKQREVSDANKLLYKIRGLNLRQKSIIYHSIQHPDTVYTIEAHRNSHGIAYDTARKDLMVLVEKRFLTMEREGKRLLLFVSSGKAIENLRKK